jgi:hypothetical protein
MLPPAVAGRHRRGARVGRAVFCRQTWYNSRHAKNGDIQDNVHNPTEEDGKRPIPPLIVFPGLW